MSQTKGGPSDRPFFLRLTSLRNGTWARRRELIPQMTKFRFVTPNRHGKWYTTLELAQRFAAAIGAGFKDPRSGRFVAYPGTRLERAEFPE